MFKISEYGFSFTDDAGLSEIQENLLASNIRELCFYVVSRSIILSENEKVILFSHFKNGKFGTIYCNAQDTYFGVFDVSVKRILSHVNISEFYPQKYWFDDLHAKSQNIFKKVKENGAATIIVPQELCGAWESYLLALGGGAAGASNVPCRDYEATIDPTPHFLDVEAEELD